MQLKLGEANTRVCNYIDIDIHACLRVHVVVGLLNYLI